MLILFGFRSCTDTLGKSIPPLWLVISSRRNAVSLLYNVCTLCFVLGMASTIQNALFCFVLFFKLGRGVLSRS